MFYLVDLPAKPDGFTFKSTAKQWEPWIKSVLPDGVERNVRRRIVSNLKHIIVGLEMKAGLIVPHGERNGKSILFEPYFQILDFEFCLGVFSVCEGLGSIEHLVSRGGDGVATNNVNRQGWIKSLRKKYDPDKRHKLKENVEVVSGVRDRLHQDKLALRDNIDWHAFGYYEAFVPAKCAMQTLLKTSATKVPEESNLTEP